MHRWVTASLFLKGKTEMVWSGNSKDQQADCWSSASWNRRPRGPRSWNRLDRGNSCLVLKRKWLKPWGITEHAKDILLQGFLPGLFSGLYTEHTLMTAMGLCITRNSKQQPPIFIYYYFLLLSVFPSCLFCFQWRDLVKRTSCISPVKKCFWLRHSHTP